MSVKSIVKKYAIFRPLVWLNVVRKFERSQVVKTFPKDSPEFIQQQRCVDWFAIKGDETLRLDYDLNKSSVVFDVGGYEGEFASSIYNKYGCKIFVFEPMPQFCAMIQKRFHPNEAIKIFCSGLADMNTKQTISISGDKSSVFIQESGVEIQLIRGVDFILQNKIERIDLMKLNIEGGEYALLTDLIENGLVNRIHNIQVQFHDFIIPDAKVKMNAIQQALSKTHELTYQYEFVWENWKLK